MIIYIYITFNIIIISKRSTLKENARITTWIL